MNQRTLAKMLIQVAVAGILIKILNISDYIHLYWIVISIYIKFVPDH